ncbi:hypothetical protein [Phormidesmis priestleyi]
MKPLANKTLFWECAVIFIACVIVYQANHNPQGAGDSVANSLLAYQWLFNHQLNFDAFRGNYFYRQSAYFFVETLNGHLTSFYPIGVAIVTFPIYCLFAIVLWLGNIWDSNLLGVVIPIDITDQNFELVRVTSEKLAATLATSLSVVLFYLAANLKFDKLTSLTIAFIYAFATFSWTIGSQALWQHTATNLMLTAMLLGLLKANRTDGRSRQLLLLGVGVFLGFLFGIRPVNLVFNVAAIVYVALTYRVEVVLLLVGMSTALLTVAWNAYYFGIGNALTGGYLYQVGLHLFTLKQFMQGFLGLTVSPSRGTFVFAPIMAYAFPAMVQVFRLRANRDEKLLLSLTLSSLVLFASYCFFAIWWAGAGYGPRFMTEILTVPCFLIGYPVSAAVQSFLNGAKRSLLYIIPFGTVLVLSTAVQLFGAFGGNNWDVVPIYADLRISSTSASRFWDFADSPIARNAKSIFFKVLPPAVKSPAYAANLNGAIDQVQDLQGQLVRKLSGMPGEIIPLRVTLRNLGTAHWLGYESVTEVGSVRVRTRLYDGDQLVNESRLPVSQRVCHTPLIARSHCWALGSLQLPRTFGTYRLVLDLIAEGVKEIQLSAIVLPVVVSADSVQFSQHFFNVQAPAQMRVRESAPFIAAVGNPNSFPWLSRDTPNPVTFASRWFNADGSLLKEEVRQHVFYDVVPTGGMIFRGTLTAPDRPGNYQVRLTMVQEGVTWFDDRGAIPKEIPIRVTAQ